MWKMVDLSIRYRRRITTILRQYCFLITFCLPIIVFTFLLLNTMNDLYNNSGQSSKSMPFVTQFGKSDFRAVSKKRILAWTGFFDDLSWEDMHDEHFQTCNVKSCTFTNNRKLLDDSDAILIHSGALTSVMRSLDLPTKRYAFQRWIIFNVEPPTRTLLSYGQLEGLFNWTAWYRLDSDVPVKYGGLIKYERIEKLRYYSSSSNYGRKNTRLAAWMSSNCHDYGRRQLFIREMKSHLGDQMDLYGACGTKRCPETICQDVLSNYKFFFAIENSDCKNYISEKFWATLRRRQVPVVRGNVGYEKVAPPHSYINADDFPSTKALSDYLLYLSQNQTEYNKYLQWTEDYDVYSEIDARRRFWCDLCESLHDESRPSQTYTNLDGWVKSDHASCPQFTVLNFLSRHFDAFRIKYGLM